MTRGTMYGPDGQTYEVDFELNVKADTSQFRQQIDTVLKDFKPVTMHIELKQTNAEAINRVINEVSGTWGARDGTDRKMLRARNLHDIPGTAAYGHWVGRTIFPGATYRPGSDRELRFARAAAAARRIEIYETPVFGVYRAAWIPPDPTPWLRSDAMAR